MYTKNKLPASQEAILAKCFHPTGKWDEFPRSVLDDSIVARFEEMVRRYPNRLAVKMGSVQLTYQELNEEANRLAHAILTYCNQEPEPIAFLLEQGVQAMVTIMGIHKSGHFYVALEPTYPIARLQMILDDLQTGLLITNSQNLSLAQQLVATRETILNIDMLSPQLPTNNLNLHILPEAIAYLSYTSGTTGRPKGVIETHRNVLHFTRVYTNTYHTCPEDRFAMSVSNSFSAAASVIYPAFLNGTLLYPIDPHTDFQVIARLLQTEAITYYSAVPAPFREIIATLDENEQFSNMRFITLGGDRIQPADIVAYQTHFPPSCILILGLGLSEKKIVAQYLLDHNSPIPTDLAPTGYPVEDVDILLVNDQNVAVRPGEVGEMVIKSRYLSPGYWRQPELTAERFGIDPDEPNMRTYHTGDLGKWRSDGTLLHMGRKDQQVQIRGVRVEIAEVEGALHSLGDWKDVIVTAPLDARGEPRLVAYLVPKEQPIPSITTLRQQLATTLPTAMLPTAFVFLDELPLTVHDKIDRSALPLPDTSRSCLETAYVPPNSSLEKTLVEIWQEILGLDQIGIHDGFFELGGDSIRGMVILNRLQKELEIVLHVTALFDAPTIAEFAAYLMQHYSQSMRPIDGAEQSKLAYQTIDTARLAQFRQTMLGSWEAESILPLDGPKNPQAVFILAAPRSGTTLLRIILAGHSDLFSPPELQLLEFNTLAQYRNIFTGRRSWGQEGSLRAIMALKKCNAKEAKSVMTQFEAQGMSIPQFYHKLQKWSGHRLLVDKTPNYCNRLETLQRAEQWFEAPYYIHLTRHPYGMIHSYEESRTDRNYILPHNYHPRELAELIWLNSHQNVLTFLENVPASRQFSIKYEDFVRDPQKILRELCDFLSLKFEKRMLDVYGSDIDRMVDGLYSNSRMIGDLKFHQHDRIEPATADRWRENYTKDFLSDMSLELAETLGYSIEPLSANNIDVSEIDQLEQILEDIEGLSDEEVFRILNQSHSHKGGL